MGSLAGASCRGLLLPAVRDDVGRRENLPAGKPVGILVKGDLKFCMLFLRKNHLFI